MQLHKNSNSGSILGIIKEDLGEPFSKRPLQSCVYTNSSLLLHGKKKKIIQLNVYTQESYKNQYFLNKVTKPQLVFTKKHVDFLEKLLHSSQNVAPCTASSKNTNYFHIVVHKGCDAAPSSITE